MIWDALWVVVVVIWLALIAAVATVGSLEQEAALMLVQP